MGLLMLNEISKRKNSVNVMSCVRKKGNKENILIVDYSRGKNEGKDKLETNVWGNRVGRMRKGKGTGEVGSASL